jgi:hypothetical protein
MSSKLPRIGSAYELPPADAPRKAVVCAPRPSIAADTQSPAPANATAQHR